VAKSRQQRLRGCGQGVEMIIVREGLEIIGARIGG
jgi:hypothetical protein